MIAHGLGEHSGRYRHVAQALCSAGFVCFGIDHRGHGKSAGLRAYLPDLALAVNDLAQLCNGIEAQDAGKPIFLFGHSLGSLIGLEFALRHPNRLRGIALSGSAIDVEQSRPSWLVSFCLLAARYIPKVRLSPPVSPSVLTHDAAVLKDLIFDPLVDKGMWRIGTSAAALQSARRIRAASHQIRIPVLALHGGDDRLAPPSGSTFLKQNTGSDDVTVKIYAGLRHELVNEVGRDETIRFLADWMTNHA